MFEVEFVTAKNFHENRKLSKAEAIIIKLSKAGAKANRLSKLPDASLAPALPSKWFTGFYSIMMVQAFLTVLSFPILLQSRLWASVRGTLSPIVQADFQVLTPVALPFGKNIALKFLC